MKGYMASKLQREWRNLCAHDGVCTVYIYSMLCCEPLKIIQEIRWVKLPHFVYIHRLGVKHRPVCMFLVKVKVHERSLKEILIGHCKLCIYSVLEKLGFKA